MIRNLFHRFLSIFAIRFSLYPLLSSSSSSSSHLHPHPHPLPHPHLHPLLILILLHPHLHPLLILILLCHPFHPLLILFLILLFYLRYYLNYQILKCHHLEIERDHQSTIIFSFLLITIGKY